MLLYFILLHTDTVRNVFMYVDINTKFETPAIDATGSPIPRNVCNTVYFTRWACPSSLPIRYGYIGIYAHI